MLRPTITPPDLHTDRIPYLYDWHKDPFQSIKNAITLNDSDGLYVHAMIDLIQNKDGHVFYRRLKVWMNEYFWECGDGVDLLREDILPDDEGFAGMFSAIGPNEDEGIGKREDVVQDKKNIAEHDRCASPVQNVDVLEKSRSSNKRHHNKNNQPMQYTVPSHKRREALRNLYAMEQCCYDTCANTKEPFCKWYANNHSLFTSREKKILQGKERSLNMLNNLLYEITFKRLCDGECFVRSVDVFRKMSMSLNGVVNVLRIDFSVARGRSCGRGVHYVAHCEENVHRSGRDCEKASNSKNKLKGRRNAEVLQSDENVRTGADHRHVLPFSFSSCTLSDVLNARDTPCLTNNHIINLLVLHLSDEKQFMTYVNGLIARTEDWQSILSLIHISSFSVVSYLNRLPIDALPQILTMTNQSNYVLQFYANAMENNEQVFELLCAYENTVVVKGSFVRWVRDRDYNRIRNCSLVRFIQLYNTISVDSCNRDLLFVLGYEMIGGDELIVELLEKIKDCELSDDVLLKAMGHIIRMDGAGKLKAVYCQKLNPHSSKHH